MSGNLYHRFEACFPADRDAAFIETAAGARYTYGDLEGWSARFAHTLAEAGVEPGDRVAVQVEKSPEAIFLYLACLRAGAIFLPLNTGYREDELAYFAGDAEPRVVVCDPAREDEVARAAPKAELVTLGPGADGSLIEASWYHGAEFDTVAADEDEVCAILYTSGTTGRSKGAMLSHRNLGTNATTLRDLWGFGPDDVLLHVLPIYHTHGLFVATNCVLMNGTGMIFEPRFDAAEAIRQFERATVMMGVPTHYVRLLEQNALTADACRHMRLFISGSAPLHVDTFHRFRERTGHTILERYGMTETGMITSNPLDGERVAGTVGPPLPDVEVRLADEDGAPAEGGAPGVLEVRGPNVFKGYWRMPEKTSEEFRADGFFITGDIAQIDERGYVSIVGRAKDLIISGGLNVYPKEVEAAIDELDGVAESAVIGVEHPDFGEGVIAVVRREPGRTDVTEGTVKAALERRLAAFKRPKRVFFTDELPRNTMGKVQKNLLRDSYARTFTDAA